MLLNNHTVRLKVSDTEPSGPCDFSCKSRGRDSRHGCVDDEGCGGPWELAHEL